MTNWSKVKSFKKTYYSKKGRAIVQKCSGLSLECKNHQFPWLMQIFSCNSTLFTICITFDDIFARPTRTQLPIIFIIAIFSNAFWVYLVQCTPLQKCSFEKDKLEMPQARLFLTGQGRDDFSNYWIYRISDTKTKPKQTLKGGLCVTRYACR